MSNNNVIEFPEIVAIFVFIFLVSFLFYIIMWFVLYALKAVMKKIQITETFKKITMKFRKGRN